MTQDTVEYKLAFDWTDKLLNPVNDPKNFQVQLPEDSEDGDIELQAEKEFWNDVDKAFHNED